MATVDLVLVQEQLVNYLLDNDNERALSLTTDTLNMGVEPNEFIEKCITPSLEIIGAKFNTLEIFLPELISSADIVQNIVNQIIRPAIETSHSKPVLSSGKVVLATVQGDVHDIGKNVVALLLKVNGFDVVDLGVNISPFDIIAMAEAQKADIIGMSALLTTCLPYMKDVIDYMADKGIREKYSIIIGGAATTTEMASQFGADGQADSASEAVDLCKKIMQSRM